MTSEDIKNQSKLRPAKTEECQPPPDGNLAGAKQLQLSSPGFCPRLKGGNTLAVLNFCIGVTPLWNGKIASNKIRKC